MEIITFILTLLVAIFSNGSDQLQSDVETIKSTEVEVIRVIDGDTIVVMVDGVEETVRYIGIDTPEPYRDSEPACFSKEATKRNQELVSGQTVDLVADIEDRDKYNRLLRYVYVQDIFVNERLVAEGYATTLQIKPNTSQADNFRSLEDSAKSDGLGLWGVCRGQDKSAVVDTSEPVTIETASLPSGQQKILNIVGVEDPVIIIRPAAVICAESAIGVNRVRQIIDGDTPSVIEGVKLANCYRVN